MGILDFKIPKFRSVVCSLGILSLVAALWNYFFFPNLGILDTYLRFCGIVHFCAPDFLTAPGFMFCFDFKQSKIPPTRVWPSIFDLCALLLPIKTWYNSKSTPGARIGRYTHPGHFASGATSCLENDLGTMI